MTSASTQPAGVSGGAAGAAGGAAGGAGGAAMAEARAARERALVPLDTRVQKFRAMLRERDVSAFSTWEKELHKIVFDERYLLLTSRERKQASCVT